MSYLSQAEKRSVILAGTNLLIEGVRERREPAGKNVPLTSSFFAIQPVLTPYPTWKPIPTEEMIIKTKSAQAPIDKVRISWGIVNFFMSSAVKILSFWSFIEKRSEFISYQPS